MITNLIASIVVSMVTNVNETVKQSMVLDAPKPGEEQFAIARFHYEPDAKEKWVTTNIVEVTTVRFNFEGREWKTSSEKPVMNWTTHFMLAPPEPRKWILDTNNAPLPDLWFNKPQPQTNVDGDK